MWLPVEGCKMQEKNPQSKNKQVHVAVKIDLFS